jgi:signal peptidase I
MTWPLFRRAKSWISCSGLLASAMDAIVQCQAEEFSDLSRSLLAQEIGVWFTARGSSMNPTVRDGDRLRVVPVAERDVKQGQIVLLQTPGGRVVAHRIRRIGRESGRRLLTLRGDSLRRDDGVAPCTQVLGRIVAIERGGRTIDLESPFHRVLANGIACFPWLTSRIWPRISRFRHRVLDV